MVEVHDHVYDHSIFCIHNQSKGIHIHIYTWSSCIFQLVQCIFTLGLMDVSYSLVFFPKLNEIINSKIAIRVRQTSYSLEIVKQSYLFFVMCNNSKIE